MARQRKLNPKAGPAAKSATSKTGMKLARRTFGNLRSNAVARRDRYVEGLLKGLNKHEAALYAGVPERTAYREGANLWREPYVQEQFARLREKLTDEQLLTRAELVLNVKSIAFCDDVERAVAGKKTGAALAAKVNERKVRAASSALLAKLMDMEAPAKFEVQNKGGVALVPVFGSGSAEDWEKAAAESQRRLKEDVRK